MSFGSEGLDSELPNVGNHCRLWDRVQLCGVENQPWPASWGELSCDAGSHAEPRGLDI